MKTNAKKRTAAFVTLLGLLSLSLASSLQGCGGQGNNDGNRVTLILGAYTTPREAYGKALIPAFQKYWKEKTGQAVEFQESYQASGAQSRAIIGGFEADIAALSLSGVVFSRVRSGWRAGASTKRSLSTCYV